MHCFEAGPWPAQSSGMNCAGTGKSTLVNCHCYHPNAGPQPASCSWDTNNKQHVADGFPWGGDGGDDANHFGKPDLLPQ